MATKSKTDLKTKEALKKRGQYKERECPYCHLMVRNLPNHIRMKHPAESAADGVPPEKPPVTKETLISGVPPKLPEHPAAEPKTYYCQNCHAELRKGESSCWHCGLSLNWEGID